MQAIKYQLYNEIKRNDVNPDNSIEIIAKIMEIVETSLPNDDENLKKSYLLTTLDEITKNDNHKNNMFEEEKELIPNSTIEKIRFLIDKKLLDQTIITLLNASKGKYMLQKSEGIISSTFKYIGNIPSTINYYIPVTNYLPTSITSYFSTKPKTDIQSQEEFITIETNLNNTKNKLILETIPEKEEENNEKIIVSIPNDNIETKNEIDKEVTQFEEKQQVLQTVDEIIEKEIERVNIIEKIDQSLKSVLDLEKELKNMTVNITEQITEQATKKVSEIINKLENNLNDQIENQILDEKNTE